MYSDPAQLCFPTHLYYCHLSAFTKDTHRPPQPLHYRFPAIRDTTEAQYRRVQRSTLLPDFSSFAQISLSTTHSRDSAASLNILRIVRRIGSWTPIPAPARLLQPCILHPAAPLQLYFPHQAKPAAPLHHHLPSHTIAPLSQPLIRPLDLVACEQSLALVESSPQPAAYKLISGANLSSAAHVVLDFLSSTRISSTSPAFHRTFRLWTSARHRDLDRNTSAWFKNPLSARRTGGRMHIVCLSPQSLVICRSPTKPGSQPWA